MSATIYSFPKHVDEEKTVYELSLYSDIEIEAVSTCVNVFSVLEYKVNASNLSQLDPRMVIECLEAGKKSWIFTPEFKTIFNNIINNVQIS